MTKSHLGLFLLLFLTFFLLPEVAWGEYQLEYEIEMHAGGSATWIIEHRFLIGENETLFRKLSDPTYFSDTFIKTIKSLVNAAKEITGRNMSVDERSFIMTVSVSGSYSVIKYQFNWNGFAKVEDKRISIGDVFWGHELFLYGEGTVNVAYSSEYRVESVSPRPHAESNQTLTWYGIKDFGQGEPRIVLREKFAPIGFIEIMRENAPIIGSVLAIVSVGLLCLGFLRLRRKATVTAKQPIIPSVSEVKDAEEKVVNLLKAAGGSLYQSTVADRCGFSRSKTSKLLATMESKGKIKREEKGREKVVMLIEETKEFKKAKGRDMH